MSNPGKQTSLTPRERKIVKEIAGEIRKQFGAIQVVLYGSKARGDAHKFSDIDILVLFNKQVDWELKHRLSDFVYDYELEYRVSLNLLTFSQMDWDSPKYRALDIHRNIDAEGIPV